MTGIYMRVSSRSQKVASQRREIERYLSANGMTEVRWFVDEGVSGAVMERPALDRLKRAIFLGEIDAVVVYALDRLARNAVEGMTLIADCYADTSEMLRVPEEYKLGARRIAAALNHVRGLSTKFLEEVDPALPIGHPDATED